MPDRSSTMPMKVKKGMASMVSFDIRPQSREVMESSSGQSRLKAPPEYGVSQTLSTKNKSPFAASEKATG